MSDKEVVRDDIGKPYDSLDYGERLKWGRELERSLAAIAKEREEDRVRCEQGVITLVEYLNKWHR